MRTMRSYYSEESLIHELGSQKRPMNPILVRKIVLHHPLWYEHDRNQRESEALLRLAERWKFELGTLRGEITKTLGRHRDSNLELAWADRDTHTVYTGSPDFSAQNTSTNNLSRGGERSEKTR